MPMNERAANHHCHARGCGKHVKPELLMCARHWRAVPRALQAAVWRHYRKGQCDDMQVSREWHQAADAAIGYVAHLEGLALTPNEAKALILAGVITAEGEWRRGGPTR